jgi:hypothetical protein
MAGNKKPRKRYRPKPMNPSAIADALAAHVPMAQDKQMDVLLCAHQSLEALRTGKGGEQDFGMLAVAMNMSLMLCEMGIGSEYLPLAVAGQEAAARCQARAKRLGKWGLDAEGLNALRDGLELHDQQVEMATQKQISRAVVRARQRALEGNVMEAV